MKGARFIPPAAFASLPLLLATFAGVGLAEALICSIAYAASSWIIGRALLRLCGIDAFAGMDRLAFEWAAGSAALPLTALCAWVSGSVLSGVCCALVSSALICFFVRRPAPAQDETSPVSSPGLYVLSLGYTFMSVILPFRAFSPESLVRELYSDGFQRFGVIHGLSEAVPPTNVFLSGAPISYYWFSLLPAAFQFALGLGDTFVVWKCVQTVTAFFSIPVLWLVAAALTASPRAAWLTVLFAFVFPSYEIFRDSAAFDAARSILSSDTGNFRQAAVALSARDPDHIIGMLTPYSDQLLLEDYLYIPQNAVALLAVLIAGWAVRFGKWPLAALAVGGLAGTNSFILLPAAAGLAASALTAGAGTAVWCAAAVTAAAAASAGVCGIISAAAVVPAAGLFALLSLRPPASASRRATSVRILAATLLTLFLVSAAALPAAIPVMLWNYGVTFPLALAAIAYMLRGGGTREVVFALGYLLAHLLVTLALVTAAENAGQLAGIVGELRSRLSPFNFYHKSSKLVRVLLSAFAAAVAVSLWYRASNRPKIFAMAAAALLVPASVTSLVRAVSYMRRVPVRESPAGEFLRNVHAGPKTVLLIEDYRDSRILQLAPVSAFYFSSWSGTGNGLSPFSGNWVEQYLPAAAHSEAARRESKVRAYFDAGPGAAELATFLRRDKVDYLLSQHLYSFEPCAELVVSAPAAHLYRVRNECR